MRLFICIFFIHFLTYMTRFIINKWFCSGDLFILVPDSLSAFRDWRLDSPLESWVMPVLEELPNNLVFSSGWSWSLFSLKFWVFTAWSSLFTCTLSRVEKIVIPSSIEKSKSWFACKFFTCTGFYLEQTYK